MHRGVRMQVIVSRYQTEIKLAIDRCWKGKILLLTVLEEIGWNFGRWED